MQLRRLMHEVAGNATAELIVRFLFDFGYPYMALRNAIRTNNHTTMDLMWCYTLHWFRATNKNNYAIMCVYVTAFRHAMKPELATIWTVMRTASLLGYIGCNVAWDYVQERMNRDFKAFVKGAGQYLRQRLGKAASMINATRHILPRFYRAAHRPEPDAFDKCNLSQADKDALLNPLIALLPTSYAQLRAAQRANLFKKVPAKLTPPWRVVEAAAIEQKAPITGSAGTEDDPDIDDVSDDEDSDGYDSDTDPNDDETHQSWFRHVTVYLKKMMKV